MWSEVLARLGTIRSTFAEDAQTAEGLRLFALRLVSKATDKVGWEFEPHDDYLIGQLRALLLSTAGLAGHEGVSAEAKKRYAAYMSGDKKAIHPSLRSTVFKIAIKEGGQEAYEAVQKEYTTTTSVDGKEIALEAMGRVQSEQLAQDYLHWSFSGPVAMQDLHTPAMALAANGRVRLAVWHFIRQNWPMIHARLSGNMVVLERFLRVSLAKFASYETEREIADFFKDKDQKGYDRGLAVVRDSISNNARYKENDQGLVKEWLGAHGYLT